MNPYNSTTRTVSRLDEHTVLLKYMDHTLVELKDVKNNYRLLDLFTKKLPIKKLVVLGMNTDFSIDARAYIHDESQHHKHKIMAEAIVFNSLSQQHMLEDFVNQVPRIFPIQLFDSLEAATEWIKIQPATAFLQSA